MMIDIAERVADAFHRAGDMIHETFGEPAYYDEASNVRAATFPPDDECFFDGCEEVGVEPLIICFTPLALAPACWSNRGSLCESHAAYMLSHPDLRAQLLLFEAED